MRKFLPFLLHAAHEVSEMWFDSYQWCLPTLKTNLEDLKDKMF